MGASRAGEPAVFAGEWQAVHDLAKRLTQPAQTQSIPASQIQGIRENHRVRNGDTPAGPAIPGSLVSASSSHQVQLCQYQRTPKRKRGKYGPDSRISPTEESAINKAIRTSTSRKGEPVFLPAVGMEFNSAKEAKDFYNLYSWEIGFGIRRGRKKPNGNNYITRQDLVCSCEGLKEREATFRRTGCKAMVRLHRTSDHGWVISRFEMQHNHPCSTTNGLNKQWPSHSDIDPLTMDVVQKLRENNRPIERVCNVEDGDMRTLPESAGNLSPTQMSDGMEEVDTVAPKEAQLLCELEPSMHIQRMATPVPVEIEEPLVVTEETQPLGSGFSSGRDGDREDEEDPYEELKDLFPGMNGRWRPTEEEMDPDYIPDDEAPVVTSGGTHELRPRKQPLTMEMEMEDDGQSLAPSTCLRPDREDSGTLAPAREIFDRDLGSGHLSSCSPLPASAQTMVADCLLAASEHHLPLSTATRQELADLSRENEEMKAELGKLRNELNHFRSEAERVKSENSQLSRDLEKAITEKNQCRDTYGRARAALGQLKLELDPGTVEVVLSHYLRLHPQLGLQLLVEAVLEEDLPPPETDEAQTLHDTVLEGARRIAHQCEQVQAPVEDEEDTSLAKELHAPADDEVCCTPPLGFADRTVLETPPPENTASAERRFKTFADKVMKSRPKAILPRPSPKKATTPWRRPLRSRRLAAQSMAGLPASRRGEYLILKRLGHASPLTASTVSNKFNALFGGKPEDDEALRELFPDGCDIGERRRRRHAPRVRA